MNITKGHLNDLIAKDPERSGWFIGHFIEDNPEFKTDNFEVNWSNHSRGSIKNGARSQSTAKTLTILISGEYLVKFSNTNKEVVLSEQGNYLFYDASEDNHVAEALEESTVLTIRWPSKR